MLILSGLGLCYIQERIETPLEEKKHKEDTLEKEAAFSVGSHDYCDINNPRPSQSSLSLTTLKLPNGVQLL